MAGEHIIKHNNGIIIDGTGDSASPDTGITLKSYIFQYTSGSTKIIEYINTNNTLQLSANTTITGSLVVNGGSGVELQVASTGVTLGNVIGDTHRITGSLNISGSLLVNGTSPGGSTVKAGSGSAASFGGTPRTASISFTTPFSNNNYSITVTGEDARSWTIQSKAAGSFVINSNSSTALTGPVYWMATPFANS